MDNPGVWGAIDRFEGDLAVIVLDDGQQLTWPCSALPAGVVPGTVVRLVVSFSNSSPGRKSATERAGGATQVAGLVRDPGSGEWVLVLPDGSRLRWPFTVEPQAGPVTLELQPDAEETSARGKRVAGLVDDIFDTSGG